MSVDDVAFALRVIDMSGVGLTETQQQIIGDARTRPMSMAAADIKVFKRIARYANRCIQDRLARM